MLAPWKKSYNKPRQHVKKQRHYFANKCLSSQSYGISSSHVWMSELDRREGWTPKNWCFWTVVLKNILESPLNCKEIKPVNCKGNQSWIFIERTEAEAEAPKLWPPEGRTDSLEKTLMLGKKAREEDGWMPSPAQWTWVWTSSKWWWRTGKPDVLQSMVPKSQTRLSDWTTTKFRRTPPYGTVRRWWGSHLHQTSLAPEEVVLSKPLPLSKWNVHICKVKALAIPKFTPTPTSYDSISKF